jgi:integrase
LALRSGGDAMERHRLRRTALDDPPIEGRSRHEVALSPLAVEILKDCPHGGEYVFGSQSGRKVTSFAYAVAQLKERVTVENWPPHDLRRSAATGMARLGVPKGRFRAQETARSDQ